MSTTLGGQRHEIPHRRFGSSHLGLALEVKRQDVFSTPRLALTHQEDAVARRAAGQHQLSRFEAGQRPVEPLTLAERVLHRLDRRHVREQEGPWAEERSHDPFKVVRKDVAQTSLHMNNYGSDLRTTFRV